MKVITGKDTRWSYANVWEAKSIKRDKRNAEWDAEHKKLCEKRDAEYHAARMKELENK